MNAPAELCEAMEARGLTPPDHLTPERMVRFPGEGKPQRNRAGWVWISEDGGGAAFGDFSTGTYETWQARRDKPLSPAEREAFRQKVAKARAEAEAERRAQQAEAEKRARSIWNQTEPAPADHPYLIKKQIGPHRARMYKGAIVLPVITSRDKLTSLQFIEPDGSKRLLLHGRKKGCFIPVDGDRENPVRVVICEGWATGCTLAEDEPESLVIAAIDAGNLQPVAVAARCRWYSAEIVIAGDDDRLTRGNPGATKARAAAVAAKALLALPEWPANAPEHLTDFNDLAVWLAGGTA